MGETMTADITAMVGIVKSVMGLFSEFPLNIILASMLGGIGFKWFRMAKSSAGGR